VNATADSITLSLVVPVYRGAPYLQALYEQVADLKVFLERHDAPLTLLELILVNDDAADESPAIIKSLTEKEDWVRCIHMSRNFGQHQATVAGILHTAGDWVCTLDEDLQHRPKDILKLFQSATSSSGDICYAKPANPSHSAFRNIGSRWTKWLISKLSGNTAIRHFNSFRLIRGPLARAAASVVAHQTYFDVALTWFTNRISVRALDLHDEREQVEKSSGYNLRGLARHARQLFQSSEIRLLQLSSLLGLALVGSAFVTALYAVIVRVLAPASIGLPGWTSVFVAIVFFGGASAFLIGMTLDQVYFVAQHMRGRPVFFVIDRNDDARIAEWLHQHVDP
jgi:glycosyltransferase involved in cell wall biosynthesis